MTLCHGNRYLFAIALNSAFLKLFLDISPDVRRKEQIPPPKGMSGFQVGLVLFGGIGGACFVLGVVIYYWIYRRRSVVGGEKGQFLHIGNCVSNIQHYLVRKAGGRNGVGGGGTNAYQRTTEEDAPSLMDPAACPAAADASCCCCCYEEDNSCTGEAGCCVENNSCDKLSSATSSGRRVLLVSSANNDNVLILNQKQ